MEVFLKKVPFFSIPAFNYRPSKTGRVGPHRLHQLNQTVAVEPPSAQKYKCISDSNSNCRPESIIFLGFRQSKYFSSQFWFTEVIMATASGVQLFLDLACNFVFDSFVIFINVWNFRGI